jgi:hypothetical protein
VLSSVSVALTGVSESRGLLRTAAQPADGRERAWPRREVGRKGRGLGSGIFKDARCRRSLGVEGWSPMVALVAPAILAATILSRPYGSSGGGWTTVRRR